jgi:diguanylate cyclase (GGDEF)-like protein
LLSQPLDGFKEVNDSHGHAVGDRVLTAVAATFAQEARAGDVLARVGGDEFAVIAPDTNAQDALALAERLRAVAAASVAELGLPVTLSSGVCDLGRNVSAAELMRLADGALYWAKQHGRDQTTRYTPGTVSEPFADAQEDHQRWERAAP